MRLFIFILWLLHWLPLPVLGRLGKLMGTISFYALPRRRKITLTNLNLCFPDMSETERYKIAKQHFQNYGRSILERSILWWASVERVKKLIVVDPVFPMDEVKAGPVIFLCPHFVCLEMAGVVITMNTPGCSIYMKQSNPVFDDLLRRGRMRFNDDIILLSRDAGIKPIVRALHKNIPFMMLPDLDFGTKDAAFVPFFGEPAATLLAPARLAAVTNAKVIPMITTFLPGYNGWKVTIYPPFENFPGKDMIEATRRVNEFIEQRIIETPAEYLWTHRRFKTRPEGRPMIYEDND